MDARTIAAGVGAFLGGGLITGVAVALIGREKTEEGAVDLTSVSKLSPRQIAELKALPNYRKPRDGIKSFRTHTHFITTLNTAFKKTVDNADARAIIIAHAARGGGWHVPGRVPLYWWNLWGELSSTDKIEHGELFTILKGSGSGGYYHAFRAYTSPEEALAGYRGHVQEINRDAWAWLMGVDGRDKSACFSYCFRIKEWFSRKTRAKAADGSYPGLDKFSTDMAWIINRHCKVVV